MKSHHSSVGPARRESRRQSAVDALFTKAQIGEQGDTKEQLAKDRQEMRHQLELIKEAKTAFSNPLGLLAVHLKKLEITFLDSYRLFKRYDFALYIRLSLDEQVKHTAMFTGVTVPLTLIFDEVKFFNVRPSARLIDRSNFVRLDVIALDPEKPDTHNIITTREIHLFELIREMFDIRFMELRNLDRQIGEMEVEFCFQYGVFGYGVSNQFENRQKTFRTQVMHSMFHRSKPPPERLESEFDIVRHRHVGHPYFIPFPRKSHLQPVAEEFAWDIADFDSQTIAEPTHVLARISAPLRKHQVEFSKISSRHQRIDFMRGLFPNSTKEHVNLSHEQFLVPESFKLKVRKVKVEDKSKAKDSDAPTDATKTRLRKGTLFGQGSLDSMDDDDEALKQMSFCSRLCARMRRIFTRNKVADVGKKG